MTFANDTSSCDDLSDLLIKMNGHCKEEAYDDLVNLIDMCNKINMDSLFEIEYMSKKILKMVGYYKHNMCLEPNYYLNETPSQQEFIRGVGMRFDKYYNTFKLNPLNLEIQIENGKNLLDYIHQGVENELIIGCSKKNN